MTWQETFNSSIEQWKTYKQRYTLGKWQGGLERFRERLSGYLASLVLGRDFLEDMDVFLDRTGKREFWNWAKLELEAVKEV